MSLPPLLFTALAGVAWSASSATAAEPSVIYRVQRSLEPDPSAPLIEVVDAATSYDERTLLDDEGQPLAQHATVSENEHGEVTSQVELAYSTHRTLSAAELEAVYLSARPEAQVADLRARKALPDPQPLPLVVVPAVQAWRDSASPGDLMEVMVVLREQPPMSLPKPQSEYTVLVPDITLPTRRAEAIEARKLHLAALQQPLVDLVREHGGELLSSGWGVNRFAASVSPAAVDALAARDDVARLEENWQYGVDTNTGIEIRHATQVNQLLDANYHGDTSSGRNLAYPGILVGVVDSAFDEDHPALAYNLAYWKVWDEAADEFRNPTTGETSADGTYPHGSGVLSQLVADGTQDSSLTPTEQLEVSAQTNGGSLVFLQMRDRTLAGDPKANRTQRLAGLFDVNADIVNMSQSHQNLQCDNADSENDELNLLYHDDVFVVNTPGNNSNASSSSSCMVNVPGTAAGSFTAGAYRRSASDLNSAAIYASSSRGGDSHGRAMIDLIAPSGRQGATSSTFDDGYSSLGVGTSFAAPVLAGSAANVKDMMIDVWGTGTANHVGNLFATMLLMGDGQTEAGPKRDTTNPQMDELWGAGRLRLRMWGPDGLDAPHRTGLTRTGLSDGGQIVRPLNSVSGTNTALPSTVDTLSVVVWWFEPNLDVVDNYADIIVQVCNQSNVCYDSGSTAPEPRRVFVPNPGGDTWEVRVTGVDIPQSDDPNYLYLQDKRTIHLSYMWEDSLRDDTNGPTCFDEIDMSCVDCCSQTGASCVPADC